jgi:zinc transporter
MDRVADRVARSLDEIEEQVLSDDAADLRQGLGRLRRTCVRLHRQLSGLRIVFHRLEQKHVHDLKPALQLAPASSPNVSMASTISLSRCASAAACCRKNSI